jgi:hypothetical protein
MFTSFLYITPSLPVDPAGLKERAGERGLFVKHLPYKKNRSISTILIEAA